MAELSAATQSPSQQLVASAVPQRSVFRPMLSSVLFIIWMMGETGLPSSLRRAQGWWEQSIFWQEELLFWGKGSDWRNEMIEAP